MLHEVEPDPIWLRILHPDVVPRLGHIRHALFDFDGTLSVLRQGWEEVMVPVMVEAICRAGPSLPTIEDEVRAYIDRSSGILTIQQMEWLVDAVQRHGFSGQACTAAEYKSIYLERLMVRVRQRIHRLETGEADPDEYSMAGAQEILRLLAQRGIRLYLASGTDQADVEREAAALGLFPFFEGRIYGAVDNREEHAKGRVIQRILDQNHLSGDHLLVVGDGPVEIREGALRRAVTLGVATDEVARLGWNPHKTDRLTRAGADLLVADFSRAGDLVTFMCQPRSAAAA
jgi:phosphoglycolate phosphatase-like HAD superfamily hydrolase